MTSQAFEKAHHKVDIRRVRLQSVLESRLRQLSNGEFKMEQLSEVTSHDQEDGDDEMESRFPHAGRDVADSQEEIGRFRAVHHRRALCQVRLDGCTGA